MAMPVKAVVLTVVAVASATKLLSKGQRPLPPPQRTPPPTALAPAIQLTREAVQATDDDVWLRHFGRLVLCLTWVLTTVLVAVYLQRGVPVLWVVSLVGTQAALAYLWVVGKLPLPRARDVGSTGGAAAVEETGESMAEEQPTDAEVATLCERLSGRWVKDNHLSDAMDHASREAELNFLLKQAVKLINNMEVRATPESFEFGLSSVIKWFKVWERYPMDGETEVRFRRRDLRRGGHLGTAHPTKTSVVVRTHWEEPLRGTETDVFEIQDDGTLTMTANVWFIGKDSRFTFRHVYHRKA
mmetsp:Transcript_11183/g.38871  ORF Transcript_11183/g.38871 Transcript_11183/m.38871 type:complete len:299 (+) Transcript_11183:67-963(+)|eukprot:CAMPEP_0183789308 /NCGR_PEP_ID=MMETSP0803_2-20130417/344_1 /TAXON_ID=195967 /ORGANISM="Crustomastix stigmata, Strain CCMP3273" /LENGTH=298 /DNA_ID=CAMNT_0026033475 /DNA_START=60 /DNA_END=956 /DNA_ORIENTATION=-